MQEISFLPETESPIRRVTMLISQFGLTRRMGLFQIDGFLEIYSDQIESILQSARESRNIGRIQKVSERVMKLLSIAQKEIGNKFDEYIATSIMMHEDEVELIKEGIMEEYDNYFLEDSGIKLSEKAQTHLSRYFIITVTQVSTRHDFFIWLRKLLKASNEYSHVLKEFWDYCKVYERNIFLDSDIFYVRNTIKDIYPIGNALTFFLEILEDFLEIRLTFQETYDINSLYALIDPKGIIPIHWELSGRERSINYLEEQRPNERTYH